jgi:hypothetical protein
MGMMVDAIAIIALRSCQSLLLPPKGMMIDASDTLGKDGDELVPRMRTLSEVQVALIRMLF